jgi:hypothetical protein
MLCSHPKILFASLNQEECDGWVMWHELEEGEKPSAFCTET